MYERKINSGFKFQDQPEKRTKYWGFEELNIAGNPYTDIG